MKDGEERLVQAPVLHLLCIDHERLTYYHDGRDVRLTDVHGNVVKAILASAERIFSWLGRKLPSDRALRRVH